jgi:energy-coupling factor transporter ATP-binding protein EcfA2
VADTLTVVQQRTCLTSIVNTIDEEIKIGLPTVKLDPYEIDAAQIKTVSTHGIEETEHRIRELGSMIRTDHMNDVERRSIMRIC